MVSPYIFASKGKGHSTTCILHYGNSTGRLELTIASYSKSQQPKVVYGILRLPPKRVTLPRLEDDVHRPIHFQSVVDGIEQLFLVLCAAVGEDKQAGSHLTLRLAVFFVASGGNNVYLAEFKP